MKDYFMAFSYQMLNSIKCSSKCQKILLCCLKLSFQIKIDGMHLSKVSMQYLYQVQLDSEQLKCTPDFDHNFSINDYLLRVNSVHFQ